MSTAAPEKALTRNLRLYPWYATCANAFFWMPVFFLYFGAHLSLSRVLALEALYYAAVVVLEVPSGYLSDRLGRRRTLLSSAALLVGAYLLFFLGSGFATFALAQIALAAGIAFNSGTDTTFHYDSLSALGREEEYAEREALVARNALIATGLAALAGGLAASVELRFAYALSAVAAGASLLIVFAFVEPRPMASGAEQADEETPPFLGQLARCLGHLRRPELAWLFGFAVLGVVLNHVPYEFYQPYLALLGADLGMGQSTPLAAGIHMAIATLLGAGAARYSARIAARLGTTSTLLLAALLQLVIIAAMAASLGLWVVALILLRGLPSGLSTAPLNAAVTPRIPRRQRATYLSIQSLAGRLSFATLLWLLSRLTASAGGPSDAPSWAELSQLLWFAAVAGLAGLLALALTATATARRRT